jgi:hypothetical protein
LNSLHWQYVCNLLAFVKAKRQTLLESIQMAKIFPYQMTKFVHICKWIFFAISSFPLIHEITSS